MTKNIFSTTLAFLMEKKLLLGFLEENLLGLKRLFIVQLKMEILYLFIALMVEFGIMVQHKLPLIFLNLKTA